MEATKVYRSMLCMAIAMGFIGCSLAAMPAWDKLFRRPWLMKRMSNDVTNESVKCCPLGYKTEWKVSPDGEEYLHHFCTNTMACCSGLKEVLRIKSDGLNYSICVKDPAFRSKSSNSMSDLGRLLALYYNYDDY